MRKLGLIVAFFLLTSVLGVNHASAQTYKVYVQKIPHVWEKTFGNVLPNAIKYWKEKTPDNSIETVQYSDRADFVVEWASQFGDSKTGHYSTDTDNYYDKPKFTIPLGYMKGGKVQTVSPEFASLIAKHNLGHAMGISHSNDPTDIMYPQIENYVSWLDANAKVKIKNNTKFEDWKPQAQKVQAQLIKKIERTEATFGALAPSVNYTWITNKASGAEMDKAQDLITVSKKLIFDAESLKADADLLFEDSKYSDAYNKYLDALNKAKKVDSKMNEIKRLIKKAVALEIAK